MTRTRPSDAILSALLTSAALSLIDDITTILLRHVIAIIIIIMITIFFTNKEHPWSQGKRWVSLYVLDIPSTNLRIRIRTVRQDKLKERETTIVESKNCREIK